MHRRNLIAILSLLVGLIPSPDTRSEDSVDFQRDIRPILADKCLRCHGQDTAHRKADLRLDDFEHATSQAIVPGKPEESNLISRITSTDPDQRMPPANSGKSLTHGEILLLQKWIAEGAGYETHWAFTAPVRPVVPQGRQSQWIRNPIDAFVLRALSKQQLAPGPEADRVIWLRRLSLDLIGLPPTIAEVDSFLADQSPNATERQIDRLLSSEHFGERWARIWLDSARYADSNGYEKDAPREMWLYRDWVVDAFNRDLPYDEFVIQQIAGDMSPSGHSMSDIQRSTVATGFLRNSMVNEEGGADPEQFRMEAMYDRMDAIGKSVLGLTVQCAQCHSHKYDPLTQHEYYRMFAFVNNTHDAIIAAWTPAELQQRADILNEISAIEAGLKASLPDWAERMAQWEDVTLQSNNTWEVLQPVDLPYEGTKFKVLDDFSIISESYAPKAVTQEFKAWTDSQSITGFRLELLTHDQLPRGGPGRSMRGTAALTEFNVQIAPRNAPNQRTKLKLVAATADLNPPDSPQPDYLKNIEAKDGDKRRVGSIGYAIDGDANTAWTTDTDPARRNQSRKVVFVPQSPVGFSQGTLICFQPNMSHGGWNNNDNHNCLMGRFRFSLTTDANPVADAVPQDVREILAIERSRRTASQQSAVFSYWRSTVADWSDANERIESLWRQHPEGANQLVLRERVTQRTTSVLDRGDFLKPTTIVEPGVPAFLHPLPERTELTRRTFADWLVDKRSPTTARSIVNRVWQAYFGVGLVETSDDLGLQSSPPSHPELLDWLAVELMDHNWSLKHLHRLIVSSATYRQTSAVPPSQYQRDPYNRQLARGPRFRVDAEIVRDATLAASGLLSEQLGGPAVYPPAPRFLFDPPASYGPKTWNEAKDSDRYRRGLYTFRFRSVPYPMLETFDAVPGNVSCVRRSRSNTPLQALTSLNEPLFMECARALAARTITEGGETDDSRIRFAMRCCVSRTPQDDEIATLQRLLDQQRQRLASGQLDAAGITSQELTIDHSADEHAAWTLLARVLLNLDETITKE